jgi:hypothetical protein
VLALSDVHADTALAPLGKAMAAVCEVPLRVTSDEA